LLCKTIEVFERESESRVGGPEKTVVVVVLVVVVLVVVVLVVVVLVVVVLVVVVVFGITRTRRFPVTVAAPGTGSKRGM
jgi:hypothetical protein